MLADLSYYVQNFKRFDMNAHVLSRSSEPGLSKASMNL